MQSYVNAGELRDPVGCWTADGLLLTVKRRRSMCVCVCAHFGRCILSWAADKLIVYCICRCSILSHKRQADGITQPQQHTTRDEREVEWCAPREIERGIKGGRVDLQYAAKIIDKQVSIDFKYAKKMAKT